MRAAALALPILLFVPQAASAQRPHLFEARPPSLEPGPPQSTEPSVASVFLASALIPGAGQYRLGAGRWVAYVGVEAWAWINWIDTRSEADDLESAYRDLAWSVARRISVGRRADREFEYYEAMTKYAASGAFDADGATPGLQPEENAATFNGDLWKLAREIFLPAGDSIPPTEQEMAAALDYYRRNAIGPQYAWSWGDNQLEREHFRTLIRQSDEAARAGTTILGVILVNHVVSAVDALITARLRGSAATKPDRLRLRGTTVPGPHGPTPFLIIEIATP